MVAIKEARAARPRTGGKQVLTMKIVEPGSVDSVLEPLRMAKELDQFGPSARILLKPWLVEAALAWLGSRRLSREEQETVVRATRTPHRVRWPGWWEFKPWMSGS